MEHQYAHDDDINKVMSHDDDINKVMQSFEHGSSVEVAKEEEEGEINLEEITGTDEAPVIKIVNYILVKGIREKVSDIHIA